MKENKNIFPIPETIKIIVFMVTILGLQACPSNSPTSTNTDSSSTSEPQVSEASPEVRDPSNSSPIPEPQVSKPPSRVPGDSIFRKPTPPLPSCGGLALSSSGRSYHANLSNPDPRGTKGGIFCFVVRSDARYQGVLTLRHSSGNGDWDIAVGQSINPASNQLMDQLGNQAIRGTFNEIVWLPSNNSLDYYVYVYPRSKVSSKACLVFHQFDANSLLLQTLATALIEKAIQNAMVGNNPTQEYRDNASRAVTLGSSVLQNRNVYQAGYDLLLNEIGSELQQKFGGESWMYTFGLGFFKGYLEGSLQHLYQSDAGCIEP